MYICTCKGKDHLSAKIEPLENLQLYGIHVHVHEIKLPKQEFKVKVQRRGEFVREGRDVITAFYGN